MKKIMLAGVLIVFLLTATIYVFSQSSDGATNLPSDGENISQDAVDSISEDNVFLDCKDEPVLENEASFVYVTNCLKIMPNGEDFVVIREPYVHNYPKTQYEQCLQANSVEECQNIIKAAWKKEHDNFKATIRQEISVLQSSSGSANVDFTSLILSESELNE